MAYSGADFGGPMLGLSKIKPVPNSWGMYQFGGLGAASSPAKAKKKLDKAVKKPVAKKPKAKKKPVKKPTSKPAAIAAAAATALAVSAPSAPKSIVLPSKVDGKTVTGWRSGTAWIAAGTEVPYSIYKDATPVFGPQATPSAGQVTLPSVAPNVISSPIAPSIDTPMPIQQTIDKPTADNTNLIFGVGLGVGLALLLGIGK